MDASYSLRALNIGEIFDRAITIYVRNFVPLTLMVMTLSLPIAIAQGLVDPNRVGDLSKSMQAIADPKTAPAFSGAEFAGIMIIAFLAFLLVPVVYSAVAFGVADIYNQHAPTYGRAMRKAFARVGPLLGVTLLYIAMMGALYFGLIILVFIMAMVTVALMTVSVVLGVIGWIFIGLAALAFIAAFMLLFMGLAFATYATVIESKGAIAAVSSSFSRLITRKELGKALLMMLAYLGLNIGIVFVLLGVELLAESVLHSTIVDLVLQAFFGACSGAALTVLLAVYYYDVRTRNEGLDLEVELARLTSAA